VWFLIFNLGWGERCCNPAGFSSPLGCAPSTHCLTLCRNYCNATVNRMLCSS